MRAAVFDTYVTTLQGGVMHFDIVVPNDTPFEQVTEWGKAYLKSKGQEGQPLTAKQCNFCHIEEANAEVEAAFKQEGYYIIEMEGCSIDQN
jgi:hypothetical protein